MSGFKRIVSKYWSEDPFMSQGFLIHYSLMGLFAYPGWYFIYKFMNDQYVDSFWERCLAVFLTMIVVLLKVFKIEKPELSQRLFNTSIFLILMHHYSLTVRNDFNPYYITGAILSITAITIVLNSIRVFLGVALVAMIFVVIAHFVHPSNLTLFWIVSNLTVLMFGAASLYFRLMMHDEVSQGRKKIEKQFNIISNAHAQLSEQRLKAAQANRMAAIGEMASGIAHEINNPLAIIRGAAETIEMKLKNESLDEESLVKSLQRIISVTDRIKKIINGLKTFSYGRDDMPFEKKSLKELLDSTLDLCQEKFKSKQVSFIVDLQDHDSSFDCQSVQINQVLLNLLNNSIDAIESLPEKWIRVESKTITENDYACVEIRISDSGHGIPAHIQAKIFDPFFTTKGVGKGTGLGLSISKGIIVNGHLGDFFIDQNSPNTCFVIRIPIERTEALKHSAKKQAS